jgi:hypothetical protein
MLGWIHEKMATQELAQEVISFLPPVQPPLEMVPQPITAHALQVEELTTARAPKVGIAQ